MILFFSCRLSWRYSQNSSRLPFVTVIITISAFPATAKVVLTFFQVYSGLFNLCSPPFLGSETWQSSSCGLQGLVGVLCQDNYFCCQRGRKMLKCAMYVFMTLLFCISNCSSCPQNTWERYTMSSTQVWPCLEVGDPWVLGRDSWETRPPALVLLANFGWPSGRGVPLLVIWLGSL